MKFPKTQKLNSLGTAHLLVPIVAIVIIGGIGSYVAARAFSHADSLSNQLSAGQALAAGKQLTSPDKSMKLNMQSDGNLVLYNHSNQAVWASNSVGKGGNRLVMQTDSNLVIYTASSKPVWASNTIGKGGTHLVVQDDGNVVIYTAQAKPVWATNTVGKSGVSGSAVATGSCNIQGVPASTTSPGSVTATAYVKNTGKVSFNPVLASGLAVYAASNGFRGGPDINNYPPLAPGATLTINLSQPGRSWDNGTNRATWIVTSNSPAFSCSATANRS